MQHMNLEEKLELLNNLDSLSDVEIDHYVATEILNDIPYNVQSFPRNNDKYGRFYRVRVHNKLWSEELEDFFPLLNQNEYLNRCKAPFGERLLYCCDEFYWNVISELINPKESKSGKISILSFELKDIDKQKIVLPFSDSYAKYKASNQATPKIDKQKKLEYYLAINSYFKRNTGNPVYDYKISSALSYAYFNYFKVVNKEALGIQYMPIKRQWLLNFGTSFNYALLFSRVENLIYQPNTIYLEYRIDLEKKKFYFKNRGSENEYSYNINIKSTGANNGYKQ